MTAFAADFAATLAATTVDGWVAQSGHAVSDFNHNFLFDGAGHLIRNAARPGGALNYGGAYLQVPLDAQVTSMDMVISWAPGTTTGGSYTLIYARDDVHTVQPAGWTSIFNNAVHLGVAQIYDQMSVYTALVPLDRPEWTVTGPTLPQDGTTATVRLERGGRRVKLLINGTVTFDKIDALFEAYAGRYLIFQIYNTGTESTATPRVHSMAADSVPMTWYRPSFPLPDRLSE